MSKKEEPGTGILIPKHIWDKAIEAMTKDAAPGLRVVNSPVAVQLKDGKIIQGLLVGWNREIKLRKATEKGPAEERWRPGELHFTVHDIVGMSIRRKALLGLVKKEVWFF